MLPGVVSSTRPCRRAPSLFRLPSTGESADPEVEVEVEEEVAEDPTLEPAAEEAEDAEEPAGCGSCVGHWGGRCLHPSS